MCYAFYAIAWSFQMLSIDGIQQFCTVCFCSIELVAVTVWNGLINLI